MPARTRSVAHAPTSRPASSGRSATSARTSVGHFGGELLHVLAAVAVLGKLGAVPPRQDREAKVDHLGPEVVEVVLALDRVADRGQDPGEHVPDERASRIADVQRAGRVGADELDVDAASIADGVAAVVAPRVADRLDL